MKLILHGCRGSIPNPSKKMLRYGGNTTSFELSMDDFQVFFDAGSGFQNAVLDSNKEIMIFFSHFHHDHLQGLAFNKYLLKPETKALMSSALVNSEKLNKSSWLRVLFLSLELFINKAFILSYEIFVFLGHLQTLVIHQKYES